MHEPFCERTTTGRISHRIRGHSLPVLEFRMEAGDEVLAEPANLNYFTPGIERSTHWGTGLFGWLRRMWSGESMVFQRFRARSAGQVAFGPNLPGRIVRLELNGQNAFNAERGTFVASTGSIETTVSLVSSVGAGLFGKKGFILQRIRGHGDAFVFGLGEVFSFNLKKGQHIYVDPSNLLAFESSVGFGIERSGSADAMLFGGTGWFVSRLEGPGLVYIHSMDYDAFAFHVKAGRKALTEKGKQRARAEAAKVR